MERLIHRGMGSDLMALCGETAGISGHDQVRLSYVDTRVTCADCLRKMAGALRGGAVVSRMHKIIVGAPFGNWLSFPGCTSTVGTYTLSYRGGILYRLWRCARTLRYSWRTQSWVNKLGLPNPGIDSVPAGRDLSGVILSIHGFDAAGWDGLLLRLLARPADLRPLAVEMNLSCPNVVDGDDSFSAAVAVACFLGREGFRVIAKLPPVRWMDLAWPLYSAGVRTFHACNTIPSPGGGISGKPLKQYSLWAVADLKKSFPDPVTVIGGGGVTCEEDVRDYLRAGADHVAIASMLLSPLGWRKVPRLVAAAASQA